MEKSNNIEDQAMHHLLKSFVKQQARPEVICEGFDADLASLYLEHILTQTETSRYEIHLFQCSPCRTSVIALARLMEQEVALVISKPVEENQTIDTAIEQESKVIAETKISVGQRVKAFFGILSTPRFALPAIAALVLAISIPLIISQNNQSPINQTAKVSPDGTAVPNNQPQQIAQAPASPGTNTQTGPEGGQSAGKATTADSRASGSGGNPSSSGTGEAAGSAGVVAGVVSPPTETAPAKDAKEGTKSDSTVAGAETKRADETAARASEPPAPVATAQPAPPSPKSVANDKLGYIDPATTKRPQDGDRDAKPMTLKPGNTGATDLASANRPAGATIRPGDNEAQPPATSDDQGRRTGLADKSKPLREEREVRKEKARNSASRQVSDKTFFLIDDVWTDQKYNKDKELPVVPVIKDSDVYKGLLEKHSGLLKFFKGFAANEKVMVVYKGTVYKLLPQDGK